MTALAFSTAGLDNEVTRLADGRLAARTFNARKGVWGWVVYGQNMAVEAFFTDRQIGALK